MNRATCARQSDYFTSPLSFQWGYRTGAEPPEPPKACDHAPGPCGQCGLYAYHDALGELSAEEGPFGNTEWVCGAVAAWGKLEVHKDGFRAEFAEIVALGYVESWPLPWIERVEKAARAYDVPHLPGKELERYVAMVGERVPESLLPEPEKPKPVKPSTDLGAYYSPQSYHHGGLVQVPTMSWDEASTLCERPVKKRWWQR